MPTSVLLAVLVAAGLLALAPALVRRYDVTERLEAEREASHARVLSRARRRRTVPGPAPVNPPRTLPPQLRRGAPPDEAAPDPGRRDGVDARWHERRGGTAAGFRSRGALPAARVPSRWEVPVVRRDGRPARGVSAGSPEASPGRAVPAPRPGTAGGADPDAGYRGGASPDAVPRSGTSRRAVPGRGPGVWSGAPGRGSGVRGGARRSGHPAGSPVVHRRRRVLAALLLLNLVEVIGLLAVGPGFWVGFAVTATLLVGYLVHLRASVVADQRRRQAAARRARWLAARQAEVRMEQQRRARERREAARRMAGQRESLRRSAAGWSAPPTVSYRRAGGSAG